ncbi:DUF4263 domain-containing protein [Saccharopolyspora indica]|uniref:Shedu immune nuclease family protein n=1 Tax=Saccharopolyspora indica TaxID=1229659 RepID=UPI0022EAED0F|nr:Shedu immune nuclease family protein [Saccharopolyspora indica]MDA3647119.1 DUF4263 domain-containing protein [Saccharopolyspora indica]
MELASFGSAQEPNEVTYAQGRLPSQIYVSRSFPLTVGRDTGHPARYVHRVFDEEPDNEGTDDLEWERKVVFRTPGGRKQLEIQVARTAGAVRRLQIRKVPTSGDAAKLEPVLDLNREQATRLVETIRALDGIPVASESAARVDETLLRQLFDDPAALHKIYAKDPERLRTLIECDARAEDVIALRRRREVVAQMHRWLEDDNAFQESTAQAGGPERAWQKLLEDNPWILGIGLGGQLLTSWSEEKLEQIVLGHDINGPGKRADGLLRTTGVISSLVFAEIKHHKTDLLGSDYRSGCWRPSAELSGAITQAQQTVHLACRKLDEFHHDVSPDGEQLATGTFVIRPQSFLIIGSLAELTGTRGGPYRDKVRSFELFRRNTREPVILTFDELLAKAEWHVNAAERESAKADDASSPPRE